MIIKCWSQFQRVWGHFFKLLIFFKQKRFDLKWYETEKLEREKKSWKHSSWNEQIFGTCQKKMNKLTNNLKCCWLVFCQSTNQTTASALNVLSFRVDQKKKKRFTELFSSMKQSDLLCIKTSPETSLEIATLQAEPCYLVTSHEAQVAEGLAALSDLSGSLVCDVLTPASIHSLYGAAVLAYGYQSCGHGRKTWREKGRDRGEGGRERETRKGVSLTTFLMQMWQHRPPRERHGKSTWKAGQVIWPAVTHNANVYTTPWKYTQGNMLKHTHAQISHTLMPVQTAAGFIH